MDPEEMNDLLNKITNWMRDMKKQISVDATINVMNPRIESLLESILRIRWPLSKEDRQKVGDWLAETDGGEIFTEYMRILTDGGTTIPDPGSNNYDSLEILRNVCWNYSDSSFSLGLELGKAGAIHLLVADLLKYETSVEDGIKERLEELNYDVWLDIEKMKGSITDCMAAAVKNAAVVLMAISKRYEQSQNCRAEAEYAFKKKKTRIPLMVEQGYEPDGWLDIQLGLLLYIDFIDENAFEDAFSKLLKQIGDRGKRCNAVEVDGPIQRMAQQEWTSGKSDDSHQARTAVVKSTEKRVEQWATDNDIDTKKFQDVDGACLVVLKKMMRDAPGRFYDQAEKAMGVKKLADIAKLEEALRNLKI